MFKKFPKCRKQIILYRIKVLLSKFIDPTNDQLTKTFLRNSLTYHVAYYLLVTHNQLPSSPKRWVKQLQNTLSMKDFIRFRDFANGDMSDNEVVIYLQAMTKTMPELHINKSGSDNSLTFLG